jgi:hypothetical protein
MLRYFFALFTGLVLFGEAQAQAQTDSLLLNILKANPNKVLQQVLQSPQTYRCQVIYTQINRNRKNKPQFRHFYFNYNPDLYFNPASTVKLPLAALALEKLYGLQSEGLDKHTTLLFDSSYPGQKPLYQDTTAITGLPSVAHFIRRALLVSESDPYNRLYQFVGQGPINRSLRSKGYKDARITRQFMGFTDEQNRHTNAVRFVGPDDRPLYLLPPAYNKDSFRFRRRFLVGNGHIDRNGKLVNRPFDFTRHNYLPLQDLQSILQSIIFPYSVGKKQRIHMSSDDREFLLRYLSQYPSETPWPLYDTAKYYDSYAKFFFQNKTHRMPAGVRVFNKVGWAYGFITDVAYVADFANGVEFMLSATVYVNSDDILNDDKYEYESVGIPFLHALGQTIYQYELKRPRKYRPNLSDLQLEYEHRDPTDKRKMITVVDN